MSMINYVDLKAEVMDKYNKAKNSIKIAEAVFNLNEQTISNNIPNYDIKKLEFGAYRKDSFVSFFADMRGSSKRASSLEPEDTFLTIHAVMPAMLYVVSKYQGNVVDIPGDGVMALFKDNMSITWGASGKLLTPESLAVRCGEELLKAFNEIVNPILVEDKIPAVTFGVGIDSGDVIVTKVGAKVGETKIMDVKAIGISINNAAKHSKGNNEILISSKVFKRLVVHQRDRFSVSDEAGWYFEKVEGV